MTSLSFSQGDQDVSIKNEGEPIEIAIDKKDAQLPQSIAVSKLINFAIKHDIKGTYIFFLTYR